MQGHISVARSGLGIPIRTGQARQDNGKVEDQLTAFVLLQSAQYQGMYREV